MDNGLLQTAKKLNQNHKQKAWWKRIVGAMGALVVFCTTYALILPAITMEGETVCGMDEHTHSENCYTQQSVYAWGCGLDGQANVAHTHDALCYDGQGELICPLPEIAEHIHGEACYEQTTVLICGESESAPQELICGQTEDPEHTHTDECYAPGHVHDESCYAQQQTLICTTEEALVHRHTQDCRTEQTQQVLVCTMDEHTHDDTCYPEENDDSDSSEYLCGMGTTLFYVFGGLMVAAAIVLLVTKKRMAAQN